MIRSQHRGNATRKIDWGFWVLVCALALLVLAALRYLRGTVAPSAARPAEIVSAYHELFYDSLTTWRANTWLGVPAAQNPNDVWITQEIIQQVKPDFFIETGTFQGGSALLWATLLEQVNPEARVVTVDIEDQLESARRHPLFKRKVDFLLGSSTDPQIVGEIARRVQGRRTIVLLDSDHSKAHVAAELRLYSPLVSVGSYLIVQDTNVHGHPVQPEHAEGPAEALADFLAANRDFASDASRERLLFTMHPGGYLKRLR